MRGRRDRGADAAARPCLSFFFDGRPMRASAGVTIAGALIENGVRAWRTTRVLGQPRGLLCGIGTCFDCLVDVGERQAVRACLTPLHEGDEVRTSASIGGAP